MHEKNVSELLRISRVEVAPATYCLVGMRHEDWAHVLENPELSPREGSIFMVLKDSHEVTLLLDDEDWSTLRHVVRDAHVEADFRLLTFDVALDWDTVGFLSRVTEILADAGISVGALSAFTRDHLLIKQADLGNALRALGPHVAELC